MKKLLLFLVLLFTFTNYISASTTTANSYILMDMASGRILESKNMNTPKLIASITNIMTT